MLILALLELLPGFAGTSRMSFSGCSIRDDLQVSGGGGFPKGLLAWTFTIFTHSINISMDICSRQIKLPRDLFLISLLFRVFQVPGHS